VKKNCLKQHKKCNANCCKIIGINTNTNHNTYITPELDKDTQNYFNNHTGITTTKHVIGTKITINPTLHKTNTTINNEPYLIIHTRCKHLNDDNTCNIYDSNKKSRVCETSYNQTTTNLLYTPNCAYKNLKQTIPKKIMKKLKLK
jgi:hypothetical protein